MRNVPCVPPWNTLRVLSTRAPACITHTSQQTHPALLLTAVMSLTPVFSKLLIRFSGIPHNPKPVQKHTNEEVMH